MPPDTTDGVPRCLPSMPDTATEFLYTRILRLTSRHHRPRRGVPPPLAPSSRLMIAAKTWWLDDAKGVVCARPEGHSSAPCPGRFSRGNPYKKRLPIYNQQDASEIPEIRRWRRQIRGRWGVICNLEMWKPFTLAIHPQSVRLTLDSDDARRERTKTSRSSGIL